MPTPPRKPLADAVRDKPRDLTDVITDSMKSLPDLVKQQQADSRKIFEAFAEPFFGEESEFNADEEATLP